MNSHLPPGVLMSQDIQAALSGPWKPILWARVGSHAFGLATASSDEDHLGIYQVKTETLLGLDRPQQTVVHTDPDWQMHELEKYVSLALQGNPTILDLMWVDEYTLVTPEGKELVGMREEMLSNRVRKTYGGYAMHQIKRAKRHVEDPTVPLVGRPLKNMKHTFRLLNQGIHVLQTGELQVRLPDPENYHALSEVPFEELERTFDERDAELAETESVLPDQPNRQLVSDWLVEKRRDMMDTPVELENAKLIIRDLYRHIAQLKR